MPVLAWSPADTAILVAAMNGVLVLLIAWLALYTVRAVRSLQDHHRILSSLATVRGLVQALEEGAAVGGLPTEVRTRIYAAIDEQLDIASGEYMRVEGGARGEVPT
ncbi:MAG: hypothetical protein ACM33B_09130 [Pseudomonadota bacterium]